MQRACVNYIALFGSVPKPVVTAGRVALYRIPYWFAQEDAHFFGILQQPFPLSVSHHAHLRSIADDNIHFIGVSITLSQWSVNGF